MFQVFDHVRRPVVVDLKPSQLDGFVVDIDPAVGNDITNRFHFCLIFQVQLRNQNPKGAVIPVRKPCGDLGSSFRHIVHAPYQIFDRHGGNENIAFHRGDNSIMFVGKGDNMVVLILCKAGNFAVGQDFAAEPGDFFRSNLPKLAWAELWIFELFDQGSFHLAVFLVRQKLGEHVFDDSENG